MKRYITLMLSIFFMLFKPADGQGMEDSLKVPELNIGYKKAPVMIEEDTLFSVERGIGAFSAEDRAKAIEFRLVNLLANPSFNPDSISLTMLENDAYLVSGETVIMVVTPDDASSYNMTVGEYAGIIVSRLRDRLPKHMQAREMQTVVREILMTGLVLLILVMIIYIVRYLFKKLIRWFELRREKFFRGIRFRNYEFLSSARQFSLVNQLLKYIRIFIIIVAFMTAFPVIFSIFPATEGITQKILEYIWSPFQKVLLGIWKFLPNFITIFIIWLIFHYVIKFMKFLAKEVREKKLVLPGFYPEWANSTFNIIRLILYVFLFILIFPYIPGSDSIIFQGVSVFLGLLISMGSTSIVGNAMAGLVITYMRPFKQGDRIKINDVIGDVIDKSMLVTRIKTIKNEDVTIPNSMVLSGYSINYSTPTKSKGLIIHTTVTIGYDAPWKTVHSLLISAAESTDGVSKSPKPFVLQTSLDDFFVSYQINAYIKDAREMINIKSELHRNIQDQFNQAGVEIMSPHYRAVRDGNESTIPE